MLGYLSKGPEAPVPQPLVAGLESVAAAEIVETLPCEGEPGSCTQALLAEDFDDLGLAMIVKELIDALDNGGISTSKVGGGERKRKSEGAGGSAFEADMGSDRVAPDEGDVLDEKAEDPLLLPVGGVGVVPEPGEVGGEA